MSRMTHNYNVPQLHCCINYLSKKNNLSDWNLFKKGIIGWSNILLIIDVYLMTIRLNGRWTLITYYQSYVLPRLYDRHGYDLKIAKIYGWSVLAKTPTPPRKLPQSKDLDPVWNTWIRPCNNRLSQKQIASGNYI